MPTLIPYHCFVADRNNGLHNLGAHPLRLALSNRPPRVASDRTLADFKEIATGNGYPVGGLPVSVTGSVQRAGVYRLACANVRVVALGGALPHFRYAGLYNSFPTGGLLIGYLDYGSPGITLAEGNELVVEFDQAAGILTDQ